MSAVLSREEILRLMKTTPPLVQDVRNIKQQVQPNGIDLTIKEVASFTSAGKLGLTNDSRILADISLLEADAQGAVKLTAGCYLVTYNEVVNLPNDIMALAMPRSSLLRCGVNIHTAVWDAGYSGRSQSLMVVYNQKGFVIDIGARIVQLVFFRLTNKVSEGYTGIFQRENI